MHSNWHRAVLVSLLMIFSSLAGCLESESEDDSTDLGTIMVSTYHVEQIVSAIVGDAATVEIMSPSNVPVHDYEPSAADLIRLQQSEMFFYHGLGLEPWVDATLSSFGENSIDSYQTHAMPTGEVAVDYETLLIENLCKILSGTVLEMNNLSMEESDAKDAYLHAENVKHSLSFPEMHDDHDEDGHDEDGHDDHKHLESEESLNVSTVEGCPSDYVISIFDLEAGGYVLEFEEADVETFDMAILKMGGGHAHHDHGDEHGDDMVTSTASAMICQNILTTTLTMKQIVKQVVSFGWKKTNTQRVETTATIQTLTKTPTIPLSKIAKKQDICGWKEMDMVTTMMR